MIVVTLTPTLSPSPPPHTPTHPPPPQDADPAAAGPLSNSLVDSRHTYLEMCQYRRFQFDTLRRAKHSSVRPCVFSLCTCLRACLCACLRACMSACVPAFLCACLPACLPACVWLVVDR